MVFKENSLNNIDAQGSVHPPSEKPVFRNQKEKLEDAKNKLVTSLPIVFLDLSVPVKKSLENYINKNFKDKKIEEVTIGDIIKKYSEIENKFTGKYFMELDAEILRRKESFELFLNKLLEN